MPELKTVTVTVILPRDLWEWLTEVARDADISVADVVLDVLVAARVNVEMRGRVDAR